MTYTDEFDKTEKRLIKAAGCAFLGYILAFFAFWGVVLYIVAHFLLKVW